MVLYESCKCKRASCIKFRGLCCALFILFEDTIFHSTSGIGTDPVDYYNPTTMQRWQAPSSGWTPPAGWQQGTLGAGVAQYYTLWQAAVPPPTIPAIVKTTTGRIDEPQLPVGTAFQAAGVPIAPEQMIPSAAGQIGPAPQISVAAGADATLADAPDPGEGATGGRR